MDKSKDGADGRRNGADTMINHHHLIFDIVAQAPGEVGDMEGEDAGEEREVAGKLRLRRVSPRPPRSWEMMITQLYSSENHHCHRYCNHHHRPPLS